MDQFADIRPYNDSEVRAALERLLADREFIAAIASLRLGRWNRSLGSLLQPLLRWILARQLRDIETVRDFQMLVRRYMDAMIADKTSGFTVSGLDQLDPQQPYLFISNHRDIALDPAFVNLALYRNERDTVRIAIGDNLLTKPYVSDLMRLNKSFIVKRSAKGPRQVMATYKNLSAYIRHSVEEESSSIWIAQREGRAKDGNDRTEPAIIKMLAMSQQKGSESFSEHINRLRIVPVAISYELDPCDGLKARELYHREVDGSYQKAEHEDVQSIARGIAGEKGGVHVSFGQVLRGEFGNADTVAAAIDQQILDNYRLQPTNFFAYRQLYGDYPAQLAFDAQGMAAREQAFAERMQAIAEPHRRFALGIYANPVLNKLKRADVGG